MSAESFKSPRVWIEAAFIIAAIVAVVWGLVWMAQHNGHHPPRRAVVVKCPECGKEVEVELHRKGGQ